MKILLTLCLCLLLVESNFSQIKEFYEKILEEKVSVNNGYFIAFDVKSNEYKGRIIVTNGNLYYFLSETKKFNKAQYKKFMTKLLLNKDILPLEKATLVRNGYFLKVEGFNYVEFMPVRKVNSVEEVASKGCEVFIKHYFNKDLVLKSSKGNKERNAIINKLFEWQIPTFIEDYGGMLAIGKSDFQCS